VQGRFCKRKAGAATEKGKIGDSGCPADPCASMTTSLLKVLANIGHLLDKIHSRCRYMFHCCGLDVVCIRSLVPSVAMLRGGGTLKRWNLLGAN
jgi:hypothetical protein